MSKRIIPSVLLAAALSGCAVGPQYRAPIAEPAHLQVSDGSHEQAGNYDTALFETRWWAQFDDPALDQLVLAVLDGNRDLVVAYNRLRAAQAHRADTANDIYPVVGSLASGDFGKGQQPGVTEDRVRTERYDLGLDMTWEIDLFGRLQRQLEASDAEAGAVAADLAHLQISLIAEAVTTYGDLRGAQLRQRIAHENLANQRVSGELTRQLHEEGLGEALDVLRNDALLAATEASIPLLEADEARARHRLFTLVGQRAQDAQLDLAPRALPAIAKPLQIGDPRELLRRRPDVAASERRLAAATATVGVATADLFPRVSLSGFLGFTSGRGSQIGSSAAQAWALGPSISWAAFDLGSVRARLRGAEAGAEGALASYEQQVLVALEESANAFSDYGKRQQRLHSLIRQSEASRGAAQLAALRYREGAVDHLVLLDAERERLTAEDAQAQAEVELYRGIVAIYKALGGGWQAPAAADSAHAFHASSLIP